MESMAEAWRLKHTTHWLLYSYKTLLKNMDMKWICCLLLLFSHISVVHSTGIPDVQNHDEESHLYHSQSIADGSLDETESGIATVFLSDTDEASFNEEEFQNVMATYIGEYCSEEGSCTVQTAPPTLATPAPSTERQTTVTVTVPTGDETSVSTATARDTSRVTTEENPASSVTGADVTVIGGSTGLPTESSDKPWTGGTSTSSPTEPSSVSPTGSETQTSGESSTEPSPTTQPSSTGQPSSSMETSRTVSSESTPEGSDEISIGTTESSFSDITAVTPTSSTDDNNETDEGENWGEEYGVGSMLASQYVLINEEEVTVIEPEYIYIVNSVEVGSNLQVDFMVSTDGGDTALLTSEDVQNAVEASQQAISEDLGVQVEISLPGGDSSDLEGWAIALIVIVVLVVVGLVAAAGVFYYRKKNKAGSGYNNMQGEDDLQLVERSATPHYGGTWELGNQLEHQGYDDPPLDLSEQEPSRGDRPRLELSQEPHSFGYDQEGDSRNLSQVTIPGDVHESSLR